MVFKKNKLVNKTMKIGASLILASAMMVSCGDDDDSSSSNTGGDAPAAQAVGGVYIMTNGDGQVAGNNVQGANSIVSYARLADGSLTSEAITATGGNGGDFDGGEGLDPLISAYAITKTDDNAFVLAVNAGSNSISALPVNDDFTLGTAVTESTSAIGPNSIDVHMAPESMTGVHSLVLVTNVTRAEFLDFGEPRHRGTLDAFWLLDDGTLTPAGASVDLDNRPSAVHISPDGAFAIVTSINAGAAGLDVGATDNLGAGSTAVGNQDEITLFSITDGALARLDGATSTSRGNSDERNLPSAIGAQIVTGTDGSFYAVVTEAREFRYQGLPPIFPGLQSGSVSTWRINGSTLDPVALDVTAGPEGSGRTACWLDFNEDNSLFYVSNAIEASVATYSFDNGLIELVEANSANGLGVGGIAQGEDAFAVTEGWIDLWVADGFLYQLHGLEGVVSVWDTNNGTNFSLVEEVSSDDIPVNNTQGIVAF